MDRLEAMSTFLAVVARKRRPRAASERGLLWQSGFPQPLNVQLHFR
jgi:hypothetical protein